MARQTTLDGTPTEPWRDAQLMREAWNDCESVIELSKKLECGKSTAYRWLDRHEIRKRDRRATVPTYHTRTDGYEAVTDDNENVLIHRLVAVAEYGFDRVAGSVIHHKNTHKWDNRPENLEPFSSHAAHSREHSRPKPTDDQESIEAYPAGPRHDRADQLDVDDEQSSLFDFS